MKRHSHILIPSSLLIFIICQIACQVTIRPITPQETQKGGAAPSEKSTTTAIEKELPAEKLSVTHRTIKLNGKILNYTATAGYMQMKDESGKLKANLFLWPM